LLVAPLVTVAAFTALAARAEAVETGQVLEDQRLKQLDGTLAPLFDRAPVTVVLFFRTQHERSLEALKGIAVSQAQLAGKPVRWVGVVPGDTVLAEAKADVAASGAKLTVLVDEADALYSKLGIRMHPGIGIFDKGRKLVVYEPFHSVDYVVILTARIRRVLGEIGDAELAVAVAPPQSTMPGDDVGGVAKRHVSFGRKLLAGKAYAAAHENARKAVAQSPSAAAWTLEGDIFAAEGKLADAAKAYDAALALEPAFAAALAGKQACSR
jgi:hypothetical protein